MKVTPWPSLRFYTFTLKHPSPLCIVAASLSRHCSLVSPSSTFRLPHSIHSGSKSSSLHPHQLPHPVFPSTPSRSPTPRGRPTLTSLLVISSYLNRALPTSLQLQIPPSLKLLTPTPDKTPGTTLNSQHTTPRTKHSLDIAPPRTPRHSTSVLAPSVVPARRRTIPSETMLVLAPR